MIQSPSLLLPRKACAPAPEFAPLRILPYLWEAPAPFFARNRTTIQRLINIVNRTATGRDAGVERLFVRMKPREIGKQTGMDIQNSIAKRCNEPGREQAHVSGKTDNIDLVLA